MALIEQFQTSDLKLLPLLPRRLRLCDRHMLHFSLHSCKSRRSAATLQRCIRPDRDPRRMGSRPRRAQLESGEFQHFEVINLLEKIARKRAPILSHARDGSARIETRNSRVIDNLGGIVLWGNSGSVICTKWCNRVFIERIYGKVVSAGILCRLDFALFFNGVVQIVPSSRCVNTRCDLYT